MTVHQAHVLVADADKSFSNTILGGLRDEGFSVSMASSGNQAIEMVEDSCPDLLMADRLLPGVSGIELCRTFKGRSETKQLPIMLLGSNSDDVDLARALNTGADDFVHKPASLVELVARTRALLRRSKPASVGERLEYQDIVVEMDTFRAYRGERLLKLGPTEFNILATFVQKPLRIWSRDQLLDTVWGPNTFVDIRTVDVHVGRLRKTLRANGEGDPFRTVRGTGYALG